MYERKIPKLKGGIVNEYWLNYIWEVKKHKLTINMYITAVV